MNEHHIPIERLIDYLHRELDSAEDAQVHAHLDACGHCRCVYDEEAQLSDTLRSYARASECELPPGLATRIKARTQESVPISGWTRLRLWMRPLVVVPVGAAVALALYFTSTALHTSTTTATTIGAVYYLEDHAALTSTVPFGSSGSVVPASLVSDNTGADQRWVATNSSASNAP